MGSLCAVLSTEMTSFRTVEEEFTFVILCNILNISSIAVISLVVREKKNIIPISTTDLGMQSIPLQVDGEEREDSEDECVKEPSCPPLAVPVLESGLKISHTSPDISLEVQAKLEKKHLRTLGRDRVQRQITEPTSSVRSVYLSPAEFLPHPHLLAFFCFAPFSKRSKQKWGNEQSHINLNITRIQSVECYKYNQHSLVHSPTPYKFKKVLHITFFRESLGLGKGFFLSVSRSIHWT